jgi:hypothetical protein
MTIKKRGVLLIGRICCRSIPSISCCDRLRRRACVSRLPVGGRRPLPRRNNLLGAGAWRKLQCRRSLYPDCLFGPPFNRRFAPTSPRTQEPPWIRSTVSMLATSPSQRRWRSICRALARVTAPPPGTGAVGVQGVSAALSTGFSAAVYFVI